MSAIMYSCFYAFEALLRSLPGIDLMLSILLKIMLGLVFKSIVTHIYEFINVMILAYT